MAKPQRPPSGRIRQSQVVTTYGPGALLDLPDDSVLVAGLEQWLDVKDEILEPRLVEKLKRVLEVPALRLYAPPPDRDDPLAPRSGIAVWRFPCWYLSQDVRSEEGGTRRLRLLVPESRVLRSRYEDDDRKSHALIPIRFVRACPRGHIGDIDWYVFVHEGQTSCLRQLWLEERGTTGDLAALTVRCECKAERRLSEAMDRAKNALGTCDGARPWLGRFAPESCAERNRLLLRHASNAYFPQLLSVISLPDASVRLVQAMDPIWEDFLAGVESLETLEYERKKSIVKKALEGFTSDVVLAEIVKRRSGAPAEARSVKLAELETLLAPGSRLGQDQPETTFYAEELAREAWARPLTSAVERVLLVHRLREVTAALGFTRFEPTAPDVNGELEIGARRASLSREADWLPAVENRGEGVFFSFHKQAIAAWLARPGTVARGKRLEAGFEAWKKEHKGTKRKFFGLPYILLHSLSHLLITEMSLVCGYPASSIRERIYAGEGGFGILLFTASPDAEGTLGGLIETGRELARHLEVALEERGRLCSNDPVCAEHDPTSAHEQRFLLGAACHGCLLIAEPSCEQRNDYLDRALVVPTVGDREAAFFHRAAS